MVAPDGLLIVDKESGWTSHDVVAKTRRLAGTRKVGHAGTLDPMATGVLVVGIGRATRLLGYLALSTKGYDATIRLGQTTVTEDAAGRIVEARDASGVAEVDIVAAIAALTGDLQQVPSAVSAIKVDGRRAYRRVHAGEDVELPARTVTVSEFAVLAVRRHQAVVDVDVHVECSTGTYVRALARDLGAALEIGGHLTALRRTRVGPYEISQASTLAQLAQELGVIALDEAAAASFPTHTLNELDVSAVRNGRPLKQRLATATPEASAWLAASESGAGAPIAVFSPVGEFLALYEQHGPVAKAVAVFSPAGEQKGSTDAAS